MRLHTISELAKQDTQNVKATGSVFQIYGRLFQYAKPHRKYLIMAVITLSVASFISFVIPQSTRIIVDDIIPSAAYHQLIWLGIGIISLALILGILNFFSTYSMTIAGQKTIFDIRNKVFQHLQLLSLSFFDNRRTGELMSRVTNDTNMLQQLITSGVVEIFKDIFIFIVVMGYLIYVDWQLALVLFMTFPLMVFATRFFSGRMRSAYRDVQVQTANINDHLQDTFSNIKLVQSFANEAHEADEFIRRNEKNLKANISAVRLSAMYAPVIEILNYLGLAVIIVFGTFRTLEGMLSVGELVAFLVYLRMLQQPIRRFTRVVNVIQQAAASSERIFDIIDTRSEITDKDGAVQLMAKRGHVQMEKVSFMYQNSKKVLDQFSLEIPPGKTIALVGPSGAGKSTVANLIMRFYDPVEGRITFDGYDLREVTLRSLRQEIAYVTQEILLLNGTVKENIAYGKLDATDAEIERAARLAHAHEFIEKLAYGYDTPIGERGAKLSGGQKQRLSIARALLKNPKLLILDEATSSLDTESESLIQEALDVLLKHRTCLVIAHRLSTIQQADQIVVMDQGRIVEQGSHEELLARQGKYAHLYALQFKQTSSG